MNILLAERKAVQLINQYIPDFNFKWMRSARVMGRCYSRQK